MLLKFFVDLLLPAHLETIWQWELFLDSVFKTGELVDLGVDKRVLDKSGAWYSFGGERLGQGREAVKEFLKTNPSVAKDIEARLREAAGLTPRAPDKRSDGRAEEKRSESRTEEKRSYAGRS